MTAAPDGRIITFYSYKGGTGRTMALANVAWILAANGKRVLAADWDLESPGLHRFFHPFLASDQLATYDGVIDLISAYAWAATSDPADKPDDWHRDYAHVQRYAFSLAPDTIGLRFPGAGTLDFLPPGRQNREYSATVSAFDWDHFYERLGGGLFLDALREDMKASYDYVLIDSRTGLSDIADICTLQLPDVVVDCFTLSGQAIDGAASVARSLTESFAHRKIRVLPVPMRIDEGEKEKADFGRALARQRFEGLPTAADGGRLSAQENTAYWYGVEVPYRPFYAYEEVLATFADESGTNGTLLAAYERLTAAITDGEVTSLPPIPDRIRLRGQERFVRRRSVPQHQVAVVYAPENLMWAQWVEAVLVRAGCRVGLHDLSTGPVHRSEETTHTAVLLSRAAQNSRYAEAFRRTLLPDGTSQGTVLLRVDESPLSWRHIDHLQLDLYRLGEAQCHAALLRAFALPGPGDDAPTPVRFPGNVPKVWNGPPRNASFTGRDAVLTKIRGDLAGSVSDFPTKVVVLHGMGGVGKTQLALEYTYRFMADYDLVWWISAEHPDGVTTALAELGDRLGLPGGEDVTLAARETVRGLADGDRQVGRWLLVFDDADSFEEVRDRFPTGGGHILVTSRTPEWGAYAPSFPIGVFEREESVELLRRRASGLSAQEADEVATAMGDLPLALEQAAAWLDATATPVDLYLEQLTAHTAEGGGLGAVTAAWSLSLAQLRERSPAAARLLELCAFFSPEPISASLLYSTAMIEALKPYDPALQDRFLIGRLLREIGRLALARIDPAGNSLQVHRLLQQAIRDRLDEEQQREARRAVHRMLAAARPEGDEPVDDPATWAGFEIIWPHLKTARVRDSDDPEVRRLLVDRVRYLEKRGSLPQARRLAEDLLDHWRPLLGVDDPLYLYLRGRLADVLRAQGLFAEAHEIDEELLERQREVLGEMHPHTYITMSGLARDLAALGSYDSALDLARAAHEGFKEIFFAFHPRTLSAASDLALALRAVGRNEEARALDQETLDRRKETLGQQHPATLASAEALGRDLREAGRYGESTELLQRTYVAYGQVLGEDFPGTLRCARSLAVSLGRTGEHESALQLANFTLQRYRTLYDSPTPDSLACELSLAAHLSITARHREDALELGKETLSKYQATLGEHHPYALTALHNVAVLHLSCGDPAQAETVFARVRPQLVDTLGERHPHALFCAVNHADALAELGRIAEAEVLERAATEGLREALGPLHPEYLAAHANLALTVTAAGDEEAGARLREEVLDHLLTLLGEEEPLARDVRDKVRFSRYLEPLTI
jgi:cellulose biosynthesis protein BcsQ